MYRYKFCVKKTEDCRPLKECKWWWVANCDWYEIIECVLPEGENLSEYWDDAFDVVVKQYEV